MFRFKGEELIGAFLEVNAEYEDPRAAIRNVFVVGEEKPLSQMEVAAFVKENWDVLVPSCEALHTQWLEATAGATATKH